MTADVIDAGGGASLYRFLARRTALAAAFTLLLYYLQLFRFLLAPDYLAGDPDHAALVHSRALDVANVLAVLGGFCLIGLVFRRLRPSRLDLSVAFLMLLIYASALWSSTPLHTIKIATFLLSMTCFVVFLTTYFGRDEVLALLKWASLTVLGVSLAFTLVRPELAFFVKNGITSWRGIYHHGGPLTTALMIGIFAVIAERATGSIGRWSAIATVLVLMAAMVPTHTRTTLVVAVIFVLAAAAVSWTLRLREWERAAAITFFSCLGLALVALVLLFHGEVLAWIGRDSTLTGRTDIWTRVLAAIRRQPFLGYGFGGFFTHKRVDVFQTVYGWRPSYAHNGALDLLLALGLVGLAVFLWGYLAAMLRALKLAAAGDRACAIALGFLLCFAVLNQTQNEILNATSLWLVCLIVFMQLKALSAERAERRFLTVDAEFFGGRPGTLHAARS